MYRSKFTVNEILVRIWTNFKKLISFIVVGFLKLKIKIATYTKRASVWGDTSRRASSGISPSSSSSVTFQCLPPPKVIRRKTLCSVKSLEPIKDYSTPMESAISVGVDFMNQKLNSYNNFNVVGSVNEEQRKYTFLKNFSTSNLRATVPPSIPSLTTTNHNNNNNNNNDSTKIYYTPPSSPKVLKSFETINNDISMKNDAATDNCDNKFR